MRACASVPARQEHGEAVTLRPVMLIDGVVEPRLVVEEWEVEGPLDERRAQVDAAQALDDPALMRRWRQGGATAVLPMRLIDDQLKWVVLAQGRLQQVHRLSARGQEQRRLELVDSWTQRLQEPLGAVWQVDRAGHLLEQRSGLMKPGREGNRSRSTLVIGGSAVHVLEEDGEPWTLKTALEAVSAMGGLSLSLRLLPRSIAEAGLVDEVDLSRSAGQVLRALLEPYGLLIVRDLWREGLTLLERRHVRPAGRGRPVWARWAQQGQPMSDAERVEAELPVEAAQMWVARGAGKVVESTFELVGGWDPMLEGQADEQYGRATSSDFATYANAYRRWVLNEDGAFTGPPYNRGAAFDLNAFFDQTNIRSQPLRFLDCLTLDDAASPRLPVVEVSTDSGLSWSQYPGKAAVLEHRAGVYLDDDTLPAAFLAAAKNGTAKVRVTASLRSPEPIEARRWRGNAFAGTQPARVFELGEAFAWRQVGAASIHAEAVQAGALEADQVDQRHALNVWLVNRLRQEDERQTARSARGRITLSGAWALLRAGDRLMQAGGAGRRVDDQAQALTQRGAVVRAVRCRFGVRGRRGPQTVVEVGGF